MWVSGWMSGLVWMGGCEKECRWLGVRKYVCGCV